MNAGTAKSIIASFANATVTIARISATSYQDGVSTETRTTSTARVVFSNPASQGDLVLEAQGLHINQRCSITSPVEIRQDDLITFGSSTYRIVSVAYIQSGFWTAFGEKIPVQ